ncbi:hypothetical protein BDR26DRAFT_850477 [Obelidium mucronatum]|nr:hypothetical protein BDR26DRAFT_850477 [Obelidium mucronatum]
MFSPTSNANNIACQCDNGCGLYDQTPKIIRASDSSRCSYKCTQSVMGYITSQENCGGNSNSGNIFYAVYEDTSKPLGPCFQTSNQNCGTPEIGCPAGSQCAAGKCQKQVTCNCGANMDCNQATGACTCKATFSLNIAKTACIPACSQAGTLTSSCSLPNGKECAVSQVFTTTKECLNPCNAPNQVLSSTCACGSTTCAAGGYCDNNLTCLSRDSDPNNCGQLGNKCGSSAKCVNAACVCNDASLSFSAGACYNASANDNCGGQGIICNANQTCQNKQCTCNKGLTAVSSTSKYCPPSQISCQIQSDPWVNTFLRTIVEFSQAGTFPALKADDMSIDVVIGLKPDPNRLRQVYVVDQVVFKCTGQATRTITLSNIPSAPLTCSAGSCAGTICSVSLVKGSDPIDNINIQEVRYFGNKATDGLCFGTLGSCNPASCVNTDNDNNHCGKPNNVCRTGSTCTSGACVCTGVNQVYNANGCACKPGTAKAGDICTPVCKQGPVSEDCTFGNGVVCPAKKVFTASAECLDTCVVNALIAAGVKCSCGTTTCAQETICTGTACANPLTDPNNCGQSGVKCGEAKCTNGQCICANPSFPLVGGKCIDTTTSANCGAVGNKCGASETCSANKTCVCVTGTARLKGVCTATCKAGKVVSECPYGNDQSCEKDSVFTGTECLEVCFPSAIVVAKCSCGTTTCAQGTICTGTACVNPTTDPNNCGQPGVKCGEAKCTNGQCICANPSFPLVGGKCIDTTTSANCGAVGNKCGASETCSANKTCVCVTGTARLNGVCTATCKAGKVVSECPYGNDQSCEKDSVFTGTECLEVCSPSAIVVAKCSCGATTCAQGTICTGTACVNPTTDPNNCGQPGIKCGEADCVNSQCKCAAGVFDTANRKCVDTTRPENCGQIGNACKENQECSNGICACKADFSPLRGVCTARCKPAMSLAKDCPYGSQQECQAGKRFTEAQECLSPCEANALVSLGVKCTCKDAICTTDLICTGDKCVNPSTDKDNCGSAGNSCGEAQCSKGACTCGELLVFDSARKKCIDTTDKENCGKVGRACKDNEVCASKNCVCKSGFASLYNVCTKMCVAGPITADCPYGTDQMCKAGMEFTPQSECLNLCTNNASISAGVKCVCGQGVCHGTFICSDGECRDPTKDRDNCGGPGIKCGEADCVNSQCKCAAGVFDTANRKCVDTTTPENCGQIGNTCKENQECSNGICACKADFSPLRGVCTARCKPAMSLAKDCPYGSQQECQAGKRFTEAQECLSPCEANALVSLGVKCTCKDAICTTDLICTGDKCVNPSTDKDNCGSAGNSCGEAQCSKGACTCGELLVFDSARKKCIDTTDKENCGKVGRACKDNEVCASKNCVCKSGFASLYNVCTKMCVAGPITADCPYGTDQMCRAGMEFTPQGECFNRCTNNALISAGVKCVCGQGVCHGTFICSDGECRDPTKDRENCGGPGIKCGEADCVNSQCKCAAGVFDTANRKCVDTTTPENCGVIGNACKENQDCSNGICKCKANYIAVSSVCTERCQPAMSLAKDCAYGDGHVCQAGKQFTAAQECLNTCDHNKLVSADVKCTCNGGPTCTSGLMCTVEGKCINPSNDKDNCGSPGNSCGEANCTNGVCVCDSKKVLVKGKCIDECQSDSAVSIDKCMCGKKECVKGGYCSKSNDCAAPCQADKAVDFTCSCGSKPCESGNYCSQRGTCQPLCNGKTCLDSSLNPDCAFNGTCTNFEKDVDNCGASNAKCSVGQTCVNGKCVGSIPQVCRESMTWEPTLNACVCKPGNLLCDTNGRLDCSGNGTCTNFNTDPLNCGKQSQKCIAPTTVCKNGICVKPDLKPGDDCSVLGQKFFGAPINACIDILKDPKNCGAINYVCPSDTPNCSTGKCFDLSRDNRNCGSVGTGCVANTACSLGKCTVPQGCSKGLGDYPDCNNDNCGISNQVCKTEENKFCLAANGPGSGKCQPYCSPGLKYDKGRCVHLRTDPKNCGKCGFECGMNETCLGGKCYNFLLDKSNCGFLSGALTGGVDTSCKGSFNCVGGMCM